jgi:hypothetical protein
MAKKGFAAPAQFRGIDYKNALIRNWRALTTHINKWLVAYDSDGTTLDLAGDVNVAGNLVVTGTIAKGVVPDVSGARDTPEAALADLLTELAGLGLITDSTTAS